VCTDVSHSFDDPGKLCCFLIAGDQHSARYYAVAAQHAVRTLRLRHYVTQMTQQQVANTDVSHFFDTEAKL
jgi:hypothetical protein